MTKKGFDFTAPTLITGSRGMLGMALVEERERRGCRMLLTPSRAELDLLNGRSVEDYFQPGHPVLPDA